MNWNELLRSDHPEDQLAALALSETLPLEPKPETIVNSDPLAMVGVYLARRDFAAAKRVASGFLDAAADENAAVGLSETSKEFNRACFRNLRGELDDAKFLAETDWPLQAEYRMGLKHYALGNDSKAKEHFDIVIDSLHPQVYFNERAHWAMVLRQRIDSKTPTD